MRRPFGKLFPVLFVLALLGFLPACERMRDVSEPDKSGFFYRLQASYIYKPTGEPVEVDYVVGCNVEVQRNKYTGPTHRARRAPEFMYVPAPEGSVIGIRSPNICSDVKFERGLVPDDFMPMTVFYDDADDLSFGWGYTTEDAWDAEKSKLRLVDASITQSTYDEWKAWREAAADNYTQIGVIPGPWGINPSTWRYDAAEKLVKRYGGDFRRYNSGSCQGYVRIPAPKDVMDKIFALAPEETGRYFVPDQENARAINGIIKSAGPVFGEGRAFIDYTALADVFGAGGINRNNSGFVVNAKSHYSIKAMPEQYPLLPPSQVIGRVPVAPPDEYPSRVPVSPEWKGVLACGSKAPLDWVFNQKDYNRKTGTWHMREDAFDPDVDAKLFTLFVNDTRIFTRTGAPVDSAVMQFYDREGFIFNSKVWSY